MMKRLTGVAILALAFGATPALAAGYGDAGCGLGSVIFGNDNSKVKQVLAATTNGTFASQTFGITTGTLNCGGSSMKVTDAREFIEGNREVLAKDIARGGGETIVSLSQIAGCQDAGQVGASLQSQYMSIFPSADVSSGEVSDRILGSLQSPELGCTLS